MATKQLKFSEKEVIVMGLSMTYAVCVGLFAVIRFVQQDWVIGFVDAALSLIGLAIFIQVLIFRQADIPALMVSLVSVLGTIVTIYLKGPDQVYWAYPSAALVFYLLPTRQALIIWSVSVIIILMLLINLPVTRISAACSSPRRQEISTSTSRSPRRMPLRLCKQCGRYSTGGCHLLVLRDRSTLLLMSYGLQRQVCPWRP